jgi:pantoate--beta-alanine ligase
VPPGSPALARTRGELRAALARPGAPGAVATAPAQVGFVPTMGALHAGHRALLARARRECRPVVASVYVNPLQFGSGEDLARYPRDLDADLAVCAAEGVDVVFAPADAEMWPRPPLVRVVAGRLGELLEGERRPGHLDGVATVVAKLLHLVGPCRAYFGQKDAQQLALVRRLVADLSFDADVVACPTVREPDGLALSSRNAYLGPRARAAAPALHAGLAAARAAWRDGERDPDALERVVAGRVAREPLVELEYARLVDADTFERAERAAPGQVLALAADLDGVRLIDNVVLRTDDAGR